MTGFDLKLKRVAARVTGRALAAEMGVSPARVSRIEATQFPTEETVGRYLSALRTLTNVSHVGGVAL